MVTQNNFLNLCEIEIFYLKMTGSLFASFLTVTRNTEKYCLVIT